MVEIFQPAEETAIEWSAIRHLENAKADFHDYVVRAGEHARLGVAPLVAMKEETLETIEQLFVDCIHRLRNTPP